MPCQRPSDRFVPTTALAISRILARTNVSSGGRFGFPPFPTGRTGPQQLAVLASKMSGVPRARRTKHPGSWTGGTQGEAERARASQKFPCLARDLRDRMGDTVRVPVGLGVVGNVNSSLDLGIRFSFDNLLGHQDAGVGRADARSIGLLVVFRV